MSPWSYRLEHLQRMSGEKGIFEHANGIAPRIDLGYCTDDNARLLVVLCREPDEGTAAHLGRLALNFVLDAQDDAGRIHNRFARDGYWRWVDEASNEDCWGRAVWGLGVAAASHPHSGVQAMARWGFEKSAHQRSPWPRAMAFAALGAADLLLSDPEAGVARDLLVDAVVALDSGIAGSPWPEDRLTYANAAVPEALIAAGVALDAPQVVERGLEMLRWLIDLQQRDGRLSVVGVGGRPVGRREIQFDQQPIEVAAIADACWRAWMATGDHRWLEDVARAADWFTGKNDAGSVMFDHRTGGSYDGLGRVAVNLNEGAESTLALVSTMQRARGVLPMIRRTTSHGVSLTEARHAG